MAQTAFIANLVAPVELKFAASGKAVAKGRVAENHRGKNAQTGEWEDQGTTWRNIVAFGAQAEKLAEVPKGASLVVMGRESSRAYEKDGEQRQWTEVAVDAFGIVPKGQQSSPRPSPQGEGFGAQQGYAAPQQAPSQWGAGAGGGAQWPAAAQPGSGYQAAPQQQGFDRPPF